MLRFILFFFPIFLWGQSPIQFGITYSVVKDLGTPDITWFRYDTGNDCGATTAFTIDFSSYLVSDRVDIFSGDGVTVQNLIATTGWLGEDGCYACPPVDTCVTGYVEMHDLGVIDTVMPRVPFDFSMNVLHTSGACRLRFVTDERYLDFRFRLNPCHYSVMYFHVWEPEWFRDTCIDEVYVEVPVCSLDDVGVYEDYWVGNCCDTMYYEDRYYWPDVSIIDTIIHYGDVATYSFCDGKVWVDGILMDGCEISLGNGAYDISVMDSTGCVALYEVAIRETTGDIFIPNIFSPNGDGVNDEFWYYPSSDTRYIEVIEFFIYDRWGGIIHSGPTPWSGRHCNEGVYVYVLRLRDVWGGIDVFSGDVTLIRE